MSGKPFAKEIAFFHDIAPSIIAFVEKEFKKKLTVHYKKGDTEKLNFQTRIDKRVEEMILEEIHKRFPDDNILSEETKTEEDIMQKGRLWIINPICGTISLSRGINIFCTNIALAIDSKIVAGCVIDHTQKQYIWSVGGNKLFLNEKDHTAVRYPRTMVEINLSSIGYWDTKTRVQMEHFMSRIIKETDFILTSMETSLTFAYVALGRIDAYVSSYHHVWDVPAINFLIEQAGGVVTDIKGNPWTLDKTSTLAARDKKLYGELLAFLSQ